MEEEEKEVDNKIAKGLHTVIPLELHQALTRYAQGTADAFGKWSYATAIRELLDKSAIADSLVIIMAKVAELEERIVKAEGEAKEIIVKTFGGELKKEG